MPVPISQLRAALLPGLMQMRSEFVDERKWAAIFKPADPMKDAAEYYKTITDLNDELQSRG